MIVKYIANIFIFSVLMLAIPSSILYSQFVKVVVSVTGNIKDEVSKKGIPVVIKVFDNTGKKVNEVKSNPFEDGYYFITGLVPGNNYNLELISSSHFKEIFNLSVPNTDKFLEISRDFNLKPLEKDIQIPLAVSPFEFNKFKLRFGSALSLERLANSLVNNPNVKFTIITYPDSDADPEENKELTSRRADALMDYLVIKGVEPTRINIKSSSKTDPKNPPPAEKRAKGKKYIGSTYIQINEF